MIDVLGKKIGQGLKPFIVAELSGNHNKSILRAKQLIDAAKASGADAVKLQTYTADTMTLDLASNEFFVSDTNNLWAGQSLHELYDTAHTPWDWHLELFNYIKQNGMLPFSSPFDETSVDFLEMLDCPIYKVASFEITDIPLIKKIAATHKPIIISTGMANREEIVDALEAVRSISQAEVFFLKCTSTYPAKTSDANLVTMDDIAKLTNCSIGLSDHTMNNITSILSVAYGACIIEKHITLDRTDGGVDSSFSLEPAEFKKLVEEVNDAWQALGKITYGGTEAEQKSKQYRRSIYCSKDISAGELITRQNTKIVRPGLGLTPKHYDTVLNKKVTIDIKKGTALSFEHLENH